MAEIAFKDLLWVLIIHDLLILSYHREDKGKNKWKHKHGWSILCVITYAIFIVSKHFSDWNHVFATTLHQRNITYTHIFTHMHNTNNQEHILEKSETLFLTPSCIHTSSQATRYKEGSMFSSRVARVTFSTGTEIPFLLPFSKSHFLQETFWNNPPSPHWPLPLWSAVRIINVALEGMLPHLASDLIYLNSSCLPN